MLTKDMVIDGTEYRYWKDQCKDLSDKHLMAGYRAAGNFKGYFTIGEFRKLCIDARQVQVEQARRKDPPTTARLSDLRSFGQGERWNELTLVTQAMIDEEGEGPITKASRQKKLTKGVIQGKPVGEIINFCKGLYS